MQKAIVCIAISFTLIQATFGQAMVEPAPEFAQVEVPKTMVTIFEEPDIEAKEMDNAAKDPEISAKDVGMNQMEPKTESVDANLTQEAIVERTKFQEIIDRKMELNTELKNLLTQYSEMITGKKVPAD